MKTIHTALSPLLIVGSLCGLGFLEYPLGRIRPYLSCLYFLITWSLFIWLYYYLLHHTDTSALFEWDMKIITFTSIISMFISLFHFKGFKIRLEKLSILSDTLEKLGTPNEYQRLYDRTIRLIIGWIVMVFLMNMLDIFWMNNQNFSFARICLPFAVNHVIHVDTIKDMTWGTVLGYISSRFQRINEHIRNLLDDDSGSISERNAFIVVRQAGANSKESHQFLWVIMHVHLQLCRISREFNEVFSIQMTLQMGSYFTFLVKLFYDFYILIEDRKLNTIQEVIQSVIIYVWGILYITKVITLNHICQNVCDKANETTVILHKLSNNNLDDDLREQIIQFILQIKQREVRFSAMGLFYFDYNFIHRFFLSISTVLMILIQIGEKYEL